MIQYNRKPRLYNAVHFRDRINGLGFDYHGKVFRKTMSPAVFANKKTAAMIDYIGKMIDFLIDQVKLIPVHFSIAHDKDSININ